MDLGVYVFFLTPPLMGIPNHGKLMRTLLLEEYQILTFIDNFRKSGRDIVKYLKSLFPPVLWEKAQELSASRLCYIWDWILLLHQYLETEDLDSLDTMERFGVERNPTEITLFLLQMLHLTDNLQEIKRNFLQVTIDQLIAFRYIPLQAQVWVRLIGNDEVDHDEKQELFQLWERKIPSGNVIINTILDDNIEGLIELFHGLGFQYAMQHGESGLVENKKDLFLIYPIWNIGDLCEFVCRQTDCLV